MGRHACPHALMVNTETQQIINALLAIRLAKLVSPLEPLQVARLVMINITSQGPLVSLVVRDVEIA